jgi:molecular chaperone DnaJ
MTLSMSGKGHVPQRGGAPGDLLIVIEEQEHETLKREGINVVFELYVNFADAAIGTHIEVPTIDGKVRIKLDAGTQSGKILRLKGKGIPDINGYGKGDQLIHINVWTPKQLTREETELIEKLRKSPNFAPNPGKNEKGFFDKMREFTHN